MKKYIILLGVLFIAVDVKAMDMDYIYTQKYSAGICDSSKSYQMHRVSYYSDYYFFLTLEDNYNLNFDEYTELDINELNIPKEVLNIVGMFDIVKDYELMTAPRQVSRLLFEYLYPDKKLEYCNGIGYEDFDFSETEFDVIRNVSDSVVNGKLFDDKISFNENEEYLFTHEHLKYFELVDSAGLDTVISDDGIIIKGNAGSYQVKFKRKNNRFDKHRIFTDGKNYLISNGAFTEDEFILNVQIDSYNLVLESNINDNVCLNILNDKGIVNSFCLNDGNIKVPLKKGSYELVQTNMQDKYELNSEYKFCISDEDVYVKLNFSLAKKEDIEQMPEVKPEEKPEIKDEDIILDEESKNEENLPVVLPDIDDKSDKNESEILPPNTSVKLTKAYVKAYIIIIIFSTFIIVRILKSGQKSEK